jgi:ribosomal protein S18 acetylase RimI-like enzyme
MTDDEAFAAAYPAVHAPDLMRFARAQLLLGPATDAQRERAAMLDDRVRVLDGQAQYYGTEHHFVDGVLVPCPLALPDDVDFLRRVMGMGPLAEHTAALRLSSYTPLTPWNHERQHAPAPTLMFCEPGDPIFRDSVELRYQVLRAPLGVARKDYVPDLNPVLVHISALAGGSVVGTVALDPVKGQLRQMAVSAEHQGSAIGRALVRALEKEAAKRKLPLIWMNARAHVIGFYTRLGYKRTSDVYDEVGIPHVRMEKTL